MWVYPPPPPPQFEQLWKSILVELDSPDRVIKWVKLPSRVSIVGTQQADTLANHGRLANPLYPSEGTPNGRAVRVFTTPRSHPRPLTFRPSGSSPLTSSTLAQNSSSLQGCAGARRALFPQTPPPVEDSAQLWEGLGLVQFSCGWMELWSCRKVRSGGPRRDARQISIG